MNYPHVTNVLEVLRKKGLEFWFKTNTAEFCDAESKKGKEIGTIIHAAIQSHIENDRTEFETEYPEEVKNCLKSFFKFRKEHPEIKLKQAELEVVSEKHGFQGRMDCEGLDRKTLMIFDWKSGKCSVGEKREKEIPPIYPDHEYQVAAYVVAYEETMKKTVEQAGILVLAKDKVAYNYMSLVKTVLNAHFNEVFLPALSIYNYQLKGGLTYERKSGNGETGTRQKSGTDTKTNNGHSPASAKLPAGF